MRWIRQKIRGGAHLALFALAVHMVLSFGHVHADFFTPRSALAAATAEPSGAPAADLPGQPSHPYRDSVAHDFCAVCANISVLGSLVLAAPSALLTPQDFAHVGFVHAPAIVWVAQSRSFSQARGPPSA
jgi:hypothetical protein